MQQFAYVVARPGVSPGKAETKGEDMTLTKKPGLRGISWQRWAAGLVAIIVGLVFIVSTFANNLFEVGPAFEEMIDDFRPILETESLDQAKADIAALDAVSDEFGTAVIPGLSAALGMTPEEMGLFLADSFPAVATGAAALPQIVPTFDGLIDMLFAEQERFASADAIPTTSLPATTVPWGIFLAGIAAVVAGILILARIKFNAVNAIVLGLLLVVVPIVLSLPGKSADADELNENLKPVYTAELIQGAQQAIVVIGGMGSEMQTSMLPALAQQMQMTPEDLQAFIGQNFPATGAALQMLPTALPRFEVLSEIFLVNLDNYEVLKPVKFVPIIWTIIIGGVFLVLAGGMLFAFREEDVAAVAGAASEARETVTTG